MTDDGDARQVIPVHLVTDKGAKKITKKRADKIREDLLLDTSCCLIHIICVLNKYVVVFEWSEGKGKSIVEDRFFLNELDWINAFVEKHKDTLLVDAI